MVDVNIYIKTHYSKIFNKFFTQNNIIGNWMLG
jgi:hypothetical protein